MIVPDSLRRRGAPTPSSAAGVELRPGRRATASTSQITVVPVSLVKGLELDATVVVEPAAILDEEAQGARALYVALTRATKRLVLVHERPLPGGAAARRGRAAQTVTRMRWLAKAPMPMWRPSISTVVVPSGDAAVIVPAAAGHDVGLLEELEQAGGELQLLGDAADGEAGADA